jgi:hypothetical protein
MAQRKKAHKTEQDRPIRTKHRRPTTVDQQMRVVLPPTIQAVLDLQVAIGNRATAALLQRQNEEGSATVAGSTSSEELAADEASYTKGLVEDEDIYEDPTESLEEKAKTSLGFKSQHPSIAQLGIRPEEIKGQKLAVYIGNSNYKNRPPWGKLPGAKADAQKMKSAMEGHEYKTEGHHKDKSAEEMESIFGGAVNKAKSGDALLLYYAGHGVPEGIVGVGSKLEDSEKEGGEEKEGGDGKRGLKLVSAGAKEIAEPKAYQVTDVESYPKILQALEAGVAGGVHTTLISDACHSGAAADLTRAKAVEKLSKTDNAKVKATTEQVKRLEDMKEQIPEGGEKGKGTSRGGVVKGTMTLETDNKATAKSYWKDVVRPELKMLSAYLKAAGMPITVPKVPSDYTKAGIEQVINQVINALIDLGEQLKKEKEESTLKKAPG